ncbi:MAG: discoidin domain-containing protein [Porphyromonas sp.]|nr:discoidin domain-containing protein [Porphyromonas sp.]
MKQKSTIILAALCSALLWTGCENRIEERGPKGDIPASEISNLSFTSTEDTEAHEASITINYDVTETSGTDLLYVRAAYFDPYLGKEVTRVGSVWAKNVILPNTFKVAGTYSVTLTPVSSSDKEGKPVSIDVASVPVSPSATKGPMINGIKLSTNAQEPREGPIEDAIDGNPSTFFHSAWSQWIGAAHYIVAELPKEETAIHIEFITRHNGNGEGNPQEADIEISMDGSTWSDLTHEVYEVERQNGKRVRGGYLLFDKPFKFVRFTPTKNPGNKVFFNLAEFELYTILTTDFEDTAKKVIESHQGK